MATIDLGKIAITPEGQWSYGRYYEKLSLVIYNGQSYLSLRNTTGDNPETSRGDWMLITSRGESLYQMMVREGKFVGTEEEFTQQYLDSLKACADASDEVRSALSDILDEMDRIRAEISEVMVEEDIRIKNEAKREAAEINRKNADITRGVEERNRQEAEQRREQSMQQIQSDAEVALAMAAEAQQKAEEAILNEEERIKAENQRKIDETARIQSEEQRVNDEAMRRSREADRQESENIRQKNEGDRILAEREREEIMRNLVEELKALAANRFKIVDVLPEVGEFAVIYLVPSTTPSDNDVYDEWTYVSEKWEHIGSTRFEMDNYFTKEEVEDALATKANIQHQHTVADITDFPELYYDATAFFTSGAYPSDKYEELLEAVKAKRTVYATIDEEGYVSYIFFVSSANSDGSSSRVLLTTIFADGGYLYINTFVLQQSGMTTLREGITGKADKATTLAGYGIGDAYTKSEVDTALEGKQDILTAGNGISIEGNVISSSVAEVVDNIVNAGYVFAGVATPATDPSTPNAKVFYIANGKGTYTNFSGLKVTEDDVVVLYWDSSWHKVSTGIASQEKLSELDTKIGNSSNFVETKEDGFFIVDEDNAIGFKMTGEGLFVEKLHVPLAEKREWFHRFRWYEKEAPSALSATQVATIESVSSNYRQGGVNVGNIFFQFHNTNDNIGVYDIDQEWKLISTIATGHSVANQHNNNISLGCKLRPSDRFPLIYQGNGNGSDIFVSHISDDYQYTLVQTIHVWMNNIAWVDYEGGYLYIANSPDIYRIPIPAIDKAEVTIPEDMAEHLPNISGARIAYGVQQIEPSCGYGMVAFSQPPSTYFQLLDLYIGNVVWDKQIVTSEEIESLAFYMDTFYAVTLNGKVLKITR